MFYYLLFNSSFLKNKKSKDRYVFTLIGGSLIYLVLHATISNTCNKEILKYIWFLLLIDVSAVFVSSDFEGFSSVQFTTLTPPGIINPQMSEPLKYNLEYSNSNSTSNSDDKFHSKSNKSNTKESNCNDNKINSLIKTKKTKKKKSLSQKDLKSILKKDQNNKKVSFEDSTDIQTLSSEIETYNDEEANNINLTLESLENLQLDINDTVESQFKIPRKKLEDEYSDIGSELDLAKFEDSITRES